MLKQCVENKEPSLTLHVLKACVSNYAPVRLFVCPAARCARSRLATAPRQPQCHRKLHWFNQLIVPRLTCLLVQPFSCVFVNAALSTFRYYIANVKLLGDGQISIFKEQSSLFDVASSAGLKYIMLIVYILYTAIIYIHIHFSLIQSTLYKYIQHRKIKENKKRNIVEN